MLLGPLDGPDLPVWGLLDCQRVIVPKEEKIALTLWETKKRDRVGQSFALQIRARISTFVLRPKHGSGANGERERMVNQLSHVGCRCCESQARHPSTTIVREL